MNANSDKLLLVEDEAHLAKGLRLNFVAEGYDVAVAGDAETALDMIQVQQQKFDAVFAAQTKRVRRGADGNDFAVARRE